MSERDLSIAISHPTSTARFERISAPSPASTSFRLRDRAMDGAAVYRAVLTWSFDQLMMELMALTTTVKDHFDFLMQLSWAILMLLVLEGRPEVRLSLVLWYTFVNEQAVACDTAITCLQAATNTFISASDILETQHRPRQRRRLHY